MTLFVLVLFPLCLFWTYIFLEKNWYILINLDSIIKIYSKMCELCIQKMQIPVTNQYLGQCVGPDFWKKNINFSCLKSHYNRLANRKTYFVIRKILWNMMGEIMVPNYGYLMSTQGHWFYGWSSSSVWCSRWKNTLLGTGNLQMITNKFWCEYLWVAYVLFLDPVCI